MVLAAGAGADCTPANAAPLGLLVAVADASAVRQRGEVHIHSWEALERDMTLGLRVDRALTSTQPVLPAAVDNRHRLAVEVEAEVERDIQVVAAEAGHSIRPGAEHRTVMQPAELTGEVVERQQQAEIQQVGCNSLSAGQFGPVAGRIDRPLYLL